LTSFLLFGECLASTSRVRSSVPAKMHVVVMPRTCNARARRPMAVWMRKGGMFIFVIRKRLFIAKNRIPVGPIIICCNVSDSTRERCRQNMNSPRRTLLRHPTPDELSEANQPFFLFLWDLKWFRWSVFLLSSLQICRKRLSVLLLLAAVVDVV